MKASSALASQQEPHHCTHLGQLLPGMLTRVCRMGKGGSPLTELTLAATCRKASPPPISSTSKTKVLLV